MGSMPEGSVASRQSIRAPNPPIVDSVFQMFRMDGRTVIITGGSGGIGYEVARGLAEAGANVSSPRPVLTCLHSDTERTAGHHLVREVYKG